MTGEHSEGPETVVSEAPVTSSGVSLQCPVPSTYFRMVAHVFGTTRERSELLVDRLDLLAPGRSGEIAATVTLDQQIRQFEAMQRIGPPDWGFTLGSVLGAHSHGAITVAMNYAATVDDAIDSLVRYGRVRAPFLHFGRDEARSWSAKVTRVLIDPILEVPAAARHAVVEAAVVSVANLITSSAGAASGDVLLSFRFPAPAWHERYRQAFGRVAFDQPFNGVAFPSSLLRVTNPLADAVLEMQALRELRRRLSRQMATADLLAAVVALIEGDSTPPPSIESAAERLNLSPRTLRRRLADRDTTYRQMVDEFRRRRSVDLLAKPDLTVAAVATALGYADTSSFVRAHRRWYGHPPRG